MWWWLQGEGDGGPQEKWPTLASVENRLDGLAEDASAAFSATAAAGAAEALPLALNSL